MALVSRDLGNGRLRNGNLEVPLDFEHVIMLWVLRVCRAGWPASVTLAAVDRNWLSYLV